MDQPCPNWKESISLARRWTCCDSDKKTRNQCECQYQIQKPGACDICTILEDNEGPVAIVKDWSFWQPRAHTNSGEPGSMYRAIAAHQEPDSVAFSSLLCKDPDDVEELAELIVHESAHFCARYHNKLISEEQATDIARRCHSKNGGSIEP
jgi:hypothetical protein